MSTQSVAISPDDPRLHTPEEEPSFRKAQARALYALGLTAKAIRHQACGTVWRFIGNDTCEPWRENNSRCGQRGCVPCATHEAKMLLAKYGPLGETKLIADTILFGEWRDVLPCTPAVLEDIGKRVVALRRSIVFLVGTKAPLFVNFGMFDDHATLRIEYGGPKATEVRERVLKVFPKMHATLRPKVEFETALAMLLTPQLPQDPVERASFELMFSDIRQLRVSGITVSDLRVYCGKPEDTRKSDIAATHIEVLDPRSHCPDCGEPAIRKVFCCPDCGKPPTWMSQWTNKDPRSVKPSDLRRYNLVPYVPSEHPRRC